MPPEHRSRRAPRGTRAGRPSAEAQRRQRQSTKQKALTEKTANAAGERLQKVLAAAGLGSRRQCEELITSGRVEVDRQVVSKLGSRVAPEQQVTVDGEPIRRPKLVHFVVNKPTGTVSTNFDPSGRTRVVDLVPDRERLFTVGRLDMGSEGLMLVTNDGELANRLAHPRFGVEKTYHVLVAGEPSFDVLAQLRQGIHSSDGLLRVKQVKVRRRLKKSTVLEVMLDEGRNREIRRILARVGHKVMRLKRVSLGPLRLQDLPPGQYRRLTGEELKQLRRLVKLAPATISAPGGMAPSRPSSSNRPQPSSRKPRHRRAR